MSSTFKKLAKDNFPNATITVDKSHVIKFFNHALNLISVDVMKHPILKEYKTSPMRRLYLRNRSRLNSFVDHINSLFGELEEIYRFKEARIYIYNTRGLT